jgi:uncharacterized protein (TIGR03435 family)
MRSGGGRLLLATLLVAGFAPVGFAQAGAAPSAVVADAAAAKTIEFDAVSVRQNKTDSNISYDKTPKDGYAVEHMPLWAIISSAYGIRWDLISGGPAWMKTSYYDIQAKVAAEDVDAYRKLSKKQKQEMVQAVLADRFKLVVHIETKEMPGYELVVAKNGPKMKDSTAKRPGYGANMGDISAEGVSTATLAELLSSQIQRTVTDKTGLTGKYDFRLKWAQDQRARAPAEEGVASDPAAAGPSLFTALEEQLGLKLNTTKGPVDTLVIDRVEQPSEN